MWMRLAVFAVLVVVPATAGAQIVSSGEVPVTAPTLEQVAVTADSPNESTAGGAADPLSRFDWRPETARASASTASRRLWLDAPPLDFGQIATGSASSYSSAQVLPEGERTADRKGFVIGFGAGPGFHRTAGYSVTNQAGRVIFEQPASSSVGLATDFKVGYAPSNQLMTYYSNKAGFGNGDAAYDLVAMTGFGVTYMTRPTSPTPFLTGGLGIGVGRSLVGSSGELGLGLSVGGGYEFTRRWSIDGDVLFVRLGDTDNHAVFRGMITFTFY